MHITVFAVQNHLKHYSQCSGIDIVVKLTQKPDSLYFGG